MSLDLTLPPGEGYAGIVPAGALLRIVDLEGNQSADTLLFDAHDPVNRYSATDTVREQGSIYLTRGSRLLSTGLDLLATIIEDTCGRHDTLGGACGQESNALRYGEHVRHQHACRETFVRCAAVMGIDARGITANINFFMNVPVAGDGGLRLADGISGPGKFVELRAERDLVVLVSNCPQVNSPCNGWNPTPIRLVGTWGPAHAEGDR